MEKSKNISKDLHSIRAHKIETLKKDIEKGVYKVRGEFIAEKAISKSIFEEVLKNNKK